MIQTTPGGDTLRIVETSHRPAEFDTVDEAIIAAGLAEARLSRADIELVRPVVDAIHVMDDGHVLVAIVEKVGEARPPGTRTNPARYTILDPTMRTALDPTMPAARGERGMRKLLLLLLWPAVGSCGLFTPQGGIDITVEVDPTALQRFCRTHAQICWPESKDRLRARVYMTVIDTLTGIGYSEKVGELYTPGTLPHLFGDLLDGVYRVRPYALDPPDWGHTGFVPEETLVVVGSGNEPTAHFVLKEIRDLPCWGTDGELEGRGCGVGAEW